MKKYLALLFLLITSVCFGQSKGLEEITLKPFSNSSFNTRFLLSFGDANKPRGLYLNADSGTKKISNVMVYPLKEKTFLVYLEGATRIKLRSSIPKDSLKDYRYTVINGDGLRIGKRGMIPNSLPKPYDKDNADFGTYEITNQNLTIAIYKVGQLENNREIIILNKKLKAVEIVEAGLVETDKGYPKVTKLEKNSKGDTTLIETTNSSKTSRNLNIQGGAIPFNENNSYAEISIKPIENVFLYKILIKRQMGDDFLIVLIDELNWVYNEQNNLSTRIDKKYFEEPGKYEIIIYPKIRITDANQPENATSIKFEIGSPDFISSKQIIPFLVIVVSILTAIAGIIIFYIKRKNKRKLLIEKQQKDIAKTQLGSIRSQLNPHFMFNALAGIQSLMNEQKTDEANQYLGKFSRLTRNVLDNKELISLAEEKILLDDYLQMEQLRFGFKYQIEIQQNVDLNIEIPAMLLQPFVENAVKHGIAEKGKEGRVNIGFAKKDTDLVLELRDNGKGFDTSKTYAGYGLQLSKNRVVLLNSIYKENTIILDMSADKNGTVIKIILKEWL